MIRAVLDTNTIISAVFWQGNERKIYRAAQTQYVLLTSDAMIDELTRVVNRQKFEAYLRNLGQSPEDILGIYRGLSERVQPVEVPENVIRDPKDRIVLGCAVGGKADYIVSGDKDLLTLERYENIPILSAAQFLERLSSDHP